MKVIFEEDTAIDKRVAKVITHPAERSKWDRIEKAIVQSDTQLTVIHAKNNRNVQIQLSSVVSIESEDRMCCIRVITGERYLLNKRLKFVEEDLDDVHFVKINNQTIINTRYITAFSATDQARIKVDLSDSSSYFVSRFYIKNFRGKLS
ncbi:LytTR family DNA-binding domain-containing protein [Paenibacillus xylanexedens]|uniref:LytTR family DNA-binding domain-containing protein n=1 Tax=Paenibacillus xylanexedens TaxID=528191 RepID=UPI00119DA412|nr:LytTR family DNA-binding domain-containing protein [Paenibacillus xylanexedens]